MNYQSSDRNRSGTRLEGTAHQERLRDAAAAREEVKQARLDDDWDLPRPSLPKRIIGRLRGQQRG
jgi:hypothetical protein